MKPKNLNELQKEFAKEGFCDWSILERVKVEAIKWYHRCDGNKHKFIIDFFSVAVEDLK